MPIQFTCKCGKSLRAAEEHAGRRAKCNQCGQTVMIPGAKPAAARAAVAASPAVATAKKKIAPAAATKAAPQAASVLALQAAPKSELDDFLSTELAAAKAAPTRTCPGCKTSLSGAAVICRECGYNLQTGRRMNAYASPMTVEKRKPRRPSAVKGFFVSRLTSGKLWSGVGMMVGAAVWFFAGLAIHRIFIYPPILFVLGILSFFTGLIDGDNA